MIKKIIFDLDNTLINWEDTYFTYAVENTCKDLNITYSNKILELVINSINNYESLYNKFTTENLTKLFNNMAQENSINFKFTENFTKKILFYFSCCIPKQIDSNILNILDYLHKKYELVILTNWFEKEQAIRLKNSGLLPYFTNVYGTEKIKIKPNTEAFQTAIGTCKPEECIMIGDNFSSDILGALNSNINAIFLNKKSVDFNELIHKNNLEKFLNSNITNTISKNTVPFVLCIQSLTELLNIL